MPQHRAQSQVEIPRHDLAPQGAQDLCSSRRCGIRKTIGWHTFRHYAATPLKANGEDVKVVQESLRHANSRITLDTYTQASTPAKRQAQTKVVRMILPERIQTAEVGGGK